MKTIISNIALLSLALLTQANCIAQEQETASVWVTIENLDILPVEKKGALFSEDAQTQELIEKYSIVSFESALPDSRKENLQKVYEVSCLCNADALAEDLNGAEAFSGAEQAPEYELLSTYPDDYLLNFPEDYALDLIGAELAWEFTTGDPQVVLGVSDGSFLGQHEDLQNQYVSMVNAQGINMYYYYHGTAVATSVAGGTNNGAGKSAIGYNCNLALNTIGYNQMLQLAYGGARVINVSWTSGCFYSTYYQDIIDEINDEGTIIVASAGNGGTCGAAENHVYPASLDGVISVTSVGPNDNHERQIGDPTSTHQHNDAVDICAPGYDVALTISPGVYMTGNGTSFAAPYVSGTIGLMLSLRPCLTYDEVLDILQQSATDIYGVNHSDYYGLLGAGRLNAGEALAMVNSMPPCGITTGPLVVGAGVSNITPNVLVAPISGGATGGQNREVVTMQEPTTAFEANVYPNPTNGEANIQWNENINFDLQIFDAKGMLVLNKSITSRNVIEKVSLPKQGMYFVHFVRDGAVIWSEKLVRL